MDGSHCQKSGCRRKHSISLVAEFTPATKLTEYLLLHRFKALDLEYHPEVHVAGFLASLRGSNLRAYVVHTVCTCAKNPPDVGGFVIFPVHYAYTSQKSPSCWGICNFFSKLCVY